MTNEQKVKLQNAYILALADSITSGDSWGECVSGTVAQFVADVMNGEVKGFDELTDDEFLAACKDQCGYNRADVDYSLGDDGDLKYQTALGAVIQEIEEN